MTYIPELKGKEAEEFIRKADNAKKGSIDWSKQMEDCKAILKKSEIPIYLSANNHRHSWLCYTTSWYEIVSMFHILVGDETVNQTTFSKRLFPRP